MAYGEAHDQVQIEGGEWDRSPLERADDAFLTTLDLSTLQDELDYIENQERECNGK